MRLFRASFSLLSLCIFISFTTLSFGAAQDRIAGAVDSAHMVQLPHGVPLKAKPEFDQGIVETSFPLTHVTLFAVPSASQQKALDQLLAQQQDPKSPNFHKWLTPEEFADRFGLSQNDVTRITTWLKSQGLKVLTVARGRDFIVFSGTAGQIQSALRTEIHRYNVNGEMHFANSTPASIPASLSGVVTAFRGLSDFHPKPRGIRRNSVVPRPEYNSANFGDLVAPGDIATIYDIDALYTAGFDGTGQKLAVAGQTDVYLADIADFRSGFGLSTVTCATDGNGVITSTVAACNDPHFKVVFAETDPGVSSGDLGESDLDLEWAGAVARGAQIIFVTSPDAFDSYQYAIDNNVAPVISLSYGICELGDDGFITSDETILKQGNSEGITIVNSSGDTGAAECDPNNTDPNGVIATGGVALSYPASSPEVTGVGGTAIDLSNFSSTYWNSPTTNPTDGGTAKSYIPEIGWNDNAEFVPFCAANPTFCDWTTALQVQEAIGISSSGGGVSNCTTVNGSGGCTGGFAQPSWQQALSIPGQAAGRFSPDVSFLATPNFPGYIFCTQLSELNDVGSANSSCSPGGSAGITNALDLQNPSIIGGTSASAPVFAGMVTLLNQYLGSSGQGNLNPTLYTLAATQPNSVFHKVTSSSNVVYCSGGTPSTQPTALKCPGATGSTGTIGYQASNADPTTGYNLVTGLGSVDLNNMALALAPAVSGSFTVSSNVNSVSVIQGQSGPVTITITPDPTNGFDGTLNFTNANCSGLPSETTCNFSPPSITFSGTAAHTETLNITTTAPIGEMRSPFSRGGRMFYAALLPGLFGIFLTVGSRKRAVARGARLLGLIFVLGISTLWLGSCSSNATSGNSDPGTPPGGPTNITVTVGSGSTAKTLTIALTVTAK